MFIDLKLRKTSAFVGREHTGAISSKAVAKVYKWVAHESEGRGFRWKRLPHMD